MSELTKLLIIDGYVDEPTCLGVPFYVSTYIRYCAGATVCAGAGRSDYLTIEQVRDRAFQTGEYPYAIIVSGNPVPGKYLGGEPITFSEIRSIVEGNRNTHFFLGGPIQFADLSLNLPNLTFVSKDIEAFIYHYFKNTDSSFRTRTIEELDAFAENGAYILSKHPRYPDIICEIETGRGCARQTHCSFCVEGGYEVDYRQPEAVVREVKAIAQTGVRHFRIGKQADLFSYGSLRGEWINGFPKPEPDMIRRLYAGIRDAVPDLLTLHLDNVNPGGIFQFPDESAQIAQIITEHNTAGDVAAFGMESADEIVIRKNGLKATPDEIRFAIRLVNDIGAVRSDGAPKLLPGINLIQGLAGETRDTFRLNYEFLKSVLDDGMLLRRINIRQLKVSKGSPIEEMMKSDRREEKKLDAAFRKYRLKIRDEIDKPMLRKIFPPGARFQNIIVEQHRGDWSLARNIGSYPIVMNIPKKLPIFSKWDAFTIDVRERSLVGLTIPFRISEASLTELKQIPGLSKKAGEIFVKKAGKMDELRKLEVFGAIEHWITE